MNTKKLLFTILILLIASAINLQAQILIIGKMTHEKEMLPGDDYEGVIIVKNASNESQIVSVYQTDYLFSSDGTNLYGDPGKLPRSNAEWITFGPKRFTIITQDETVVIHYNVNIPDNGELIGTYWSMLMVESTPKESSKINGASEDTSSLGIKQVFRYGIQMATHIKNTGVIKIEFLSTKLIKDKNDRTFQVDIQNIGTLLLRATIWMELYSETGDYIGKYEGGKHRLYPDTSARYLINMSDTPNGTYKSLIIVDCGNGNVFGGNFSFILKK